MKSKSLFDHKHPIMFFIVSFLSLACKSDSVLSPNGRLPSIIPLAVGNAWTFQGTSYDTLGSLHWTFTQFDTIQGDTLQFGRRLFNYSGNYFQNTDSGIIYLKTLQIKSVNPPDTLPYFELLYKYPAFSGEAYGKFRVGKIDTVITVPAGTFTCIQYFGFDFQPLAEICETYIAPGFGIVKIVWRYGPYCFHNPNQLESTSDLTSYSINR